MFWGRKVPKGGESGGKKPRNTHHFFLKPQGIKEINRALSN